MYEEEREAVISCPFLFVEKANNANSVNILRNVVGLDAGESEALVLYGEKAAALLLIGIMWELGGYGNNDLVMRRGSGAYGFYDRPARRNYAAKAACGQRGEQETRIEGDEVTEKE